MTKDITYHHDWTVVEFDAPYWVLDRIKKNEKFVAGAGLIFHTATGNYFLTEHIFKKKAMLHFLD